MHRRAFVGTLALALLAAPIAGRAETARVAFLCSASCSNLPQVYHAWDRSFLAGLKRSGHVLGRDVAIDLTGVGVGLQQLPDAAQRVVQRAPRVIVAVGNQAVRAAREATKAVPIVMVHVADAVEEGFVDTLARPGSNVTGLSVPLGAMAAKHIELLKEINPRLGRVAVLQSPMAKLSPEDFERLERAARTLGVQLMSIGVVTFRDLESAFGALGLRRPEGLLLYERLVGFPTGLTFFALQNRILTVAANRSFVDMGALLSYGPDPGEQYERAAIYVGKLLKGANVSQLPVEQPTRFELIVNTITAKALGLTIPPSLLARADQVIE
jgi:putative ABC transport system substrate-binding protein